MLDISVMFQLHLIRGREGRQFFQIGTNLDKAGDDGIKRKTACHMRKVDDWAARKYLYYNILAVIDEVYMLSTTCLERGSLFAGIDWSTSSGTQSHFS